MLIRHHLTVYLGARCIAAASNLLAVAVFTRLAGPEIYGNYVVYAAAATVINGFIAQGFRYAFFNHYRTDSDKEFIASYFALLGASLMVVGPVAAVGLLTNQNGAGMVVGTLLIAVGTAVFDVSVDFSRTRLEATRASLGMITRGLLVLGCGTFALIVFKTPLALAIAIGAANLLAATPTLIGIARMRVGRPSWSATYQLLSFGWPLLLSFGLGAFSNSVDRLLLASSDGHAAVAAYGALSDFVRASFLVFGEGIALAVVSVAKRQFNDGEEAEAAATLGIAYRLILMLGLVGVAFFLMFGSLLLKIMFPPNFVPSSPLLLLIVTISAFVLVLRSMYFAQVIYFNCPSYLELVSVILALACNGILCALLIPHYGILGAAIGYLVGQIVSGLYFVAAAFKRSVLPIPLRPIVSMAAVTTLVFGFNLMIERSGASALDTLGAKAAVFAVLVVFSAHAVGLGKFVMKLAFLPFAKPSAEKCAPR